jgi:HTH-type transcriptional regulator / antitoxin HigA
MIDTANTFSPDWVSPPGDTIADLMEERGWHQTELAVRLGYTNKHVSQLMNGKAPVTEDTALRLERVLGGGVAFWLAREAQFRAQRARLAAADRFFQWTGWLDKIPVKELMQAGAIPKQRMDSKGKSTLVEVLLRFFGVASPDEWERHYARMEVSFHRTRAEQSDIGAISAWLRLGEIKAERLASPRYDRSRFEDALKEIRTLTVQPPEEFEPRLHELCRKSGVTLVLVPAIPRAYVSGVARWLSPQRPLIQLSLYGKTNDRFWFAFFHEAAHVLLHGKKSVFLDDYDHNLIDSKEEREANSWTGSFLIPSAGAADLALLKNKAAVKDFALSIGLHPGIVVGRLQHDALIPHSWMNDLKVSFRFKNSPSNT